MKLKITAIGEILFDVYPTQKKLGGAPFNFFYHVWKLTNDGKFISRIGNDNEGKEIIEFLEKQQFDTNYIQIDDSVNTGVVNVQLDENKIPAFEIIENRAYDFIEHRPELDELIEKSDLLYFGTLAQRNETSRNTIRTLIEKSKKVFCDINIRQNFYTKEIIHKSLQASSAVKLNADELALINDLLIGNDYELKKTAYEIIDKYNLDLLCVTLGSGGSYLFNRKEESFHKTEVNNIVDTVGAGDAYAAIMSLGYLLNWEIEKTNKLASEFAAEICTIKGAVPTEDNIYNNFIEKIKNE
ncbi:MAG TPA: carbohydrate kinase [Ignavibacteria bacterium]|nr:carbohydrate kinase [Ignavibacteria bacterium]HET54203.1 carbohydrate kinase [Ignavibacteria bacterium]